MADILDKIVGIYHFLTDRVPRDVPVMEPRLRTINPWQKNDKAVVVKIKAGEDIRASVEKALTLLGNMEQNIGRGDSVLVKPNFNSADPYPGSTDLGFLHAVLELLLEMGAKVTVGESSGGIWRPTRKVMKKLGVTELVRQLDVELVAFDDRPDDWVRININGDYLKKVTIPRLAYEADKIIYLPCMKTHKLARYSGSLKLGMGLMHPGERRTMHIDHLEQKVAEINMCLQPNLIIMDGRKAFVTGGPDKGQLAEPGLILASGDMIAIDVEAIKTILTYKAKNRLPLDPWQSAQIMTALKHGLGTKEGNYIVVDFPT